MLLLLDKNLILIDYWRRLVLFKWSRRIFFAIYFYAFSLLREFYRRFNTLLQLKQNKAMKQKFERAIYEKIQKNFKIN